ncbi:MAG: recombinase family protein, partial [Mobilitalea sp.]
MKAVIYCRVSTDEEKQVNALKGQVQEAIAAVHKQKWKLVDQYIDEGRSGTTTKKRDEYNRLVSELDQNKFDVIVVKSQDRLMRNTKEWYVFVDKLVQAQKKLFFYLDNKFYTPDDALITGIKAILAEEFSRDLSKKINNAHKSRQEKGTNVSITSNTWGYNKVKKEVVINEKEADIVRLIYQRCIEGKGSRIIAKELQTKGIKSRSGGKFPE